MSPDIHRFMIEGATKDADTLLVKQLHEEMRLRKRMYRKGFVPVLDIAPVVESDKNNKGTLSYTITMYGVKVNEPKEYEGWLSGSMIRATPLTKLQRLSSPSELNW